MKTGLTKKGSACRRLVFQGHPQSTLTSYRQVDVNGGGFDHNVISVVQGRFPSVSSAHGISLARLLLPRVWSLLERGG